MPFYEGIGLIAEKHAVVLDFGHAHTKVGYAGEATPRAILTTPNLVGLSDDALYDRLVQLVHTVYFRHLLVHPKDRRVVLVDDLLGRMQFKQAISKVLFRHFEVLSLLYAPSPLMPLLTLGLPTGLVLDVGYSEATLIPVYEGVPMLKAWQAQPLAAEAVQQRLRELLTQRATITTSGDQVQKLSDLEGDPSSSDYSPLISPDILEDIKLRLCFVTNLERGHKIQKIRSDASSVSGLSSFLKKSVPPAAYPLDGKRILHVDGAVREAAAEVMFEQDADCLSVATMVLDAILASPIDTRRELAQNIIIVGGTSMMLGFKARLFEEIKHLLQHQAPFNERLNALDSGVGSKDLLLHTPPTQANCTCWAGAAIFGATDAISTRSFTRDQFVKEKAVPDWSNLRFNSLLSGDDRQG